MSENHSTESTDLAPSSEENQGLNFDQFISEAEEKIEALKHRRASIQSRQQDHSNLKVDSETLTDIKMTQEITDKLEKAEYGLFSELVELVGEENIAWKKTGEGFWTFFRYGGIGFAIAVVLHKLIG